MIGAILWHNEFLQLNYLYSIGRIHDILDSKLTFYFVGLNIWHWLKFIIACYTFPVFGTFDVLLEIPSFQVVLKIAHPYQEA